MPQGRRVWLFAGVCVLAGGVVAASLARARHETALRLSTAGETTGRLPAPPGTPFVLVRSLESNDAWSRLALAPLTSPEGPRYVTSLTCVRAHFGGGRGVCLAPVGAVSQATVFDERFAPQRVLALTGAPSRARVSPDGRRAAVTVFEHGHSYADSAFSTRTTIVDLVAAAPIVDLEQFTAFRDGRVFRRVDFNYWGVTFAADGNRFFATLAFGGTPYLVEGDVDRREVRIVAPDVECPSLSPGGTRIAFKRRRPAKEGFGWRLWTMDLATRAAHLVDGEARDIDDQVEWLDESRILYQFPSDDGNNLWSVEVDGASPARRFMSAAWSPAVVR